MEHARKPKVLHVGELSRDLAWNIDARNRSADDLELTRVLDRRCLVDLQIEGLAADKSAVTDRSMRRVRRDPTAGNREVGRFDLESFGRHSGQRLARRRGGLPDLRTSVLNCEAARGRSLIGR